MLLPFKGLFCSHSLFSFLCFMFLRTNVSWAEPSGPTWCSWNMEDSLTSCSSIKNILRSKGCFLQCSFLFLLFRLWVILLKKVHCALCVLQPTNLDSGKYLFLKPVIIIDREAGEIIRLVASVRPSVRLSVRPFACGRSPVWTVWPLTLIFGMRVDLDPG